MALRNNHSENTAVDVQCPDTPDLYMVTRASVCLRGPNPTLHPYLMLFTLFTLWSHVPHLVTAALAEAVSFPVPPLSLSADVTEVYLYLEGLCFVQLHQ